MKPINPYKHILIAVEESDYSFRAAMEVKKVLTEDTRLTLIHAIDPNRTDGNVLPSVLNEIKYKQFQEKYEEISKEYDALNINYDLKVVKGNIAKCIISEANNGEYDLVILGATGKKKFTGVDFGSVSMKVMKQVNIPITIVK